MKFIKRENRAGNSILCLVLFWLALCPISISAQTNTQIIRGVVVDRYSQSPLGGVKVQVSGSQQESMTDSFGVFVIGDLPPQRYEISLTLQGYKMAVYANLVLISGKELALHIEMEEVYDAIEAVVVAAVNKGGTINKLNSVSGRTFSMDDVNRYAGGRSDPARLAANFAGVSAPDDSRNDIVVRGNSPVGILWRIDGMNVTNPNHFASVGTTGGAVSALNTNLLRNSDFFTSAFPAEYGNATAGVFDLGFRAGNSKKRETTLQAGVITGLEITTEGPLMKKSDASYLVGYRYSMAGVAQQLGVDIGTTATPTYQDLSFKFGTGSTPLGKVFVFGILANSTIAIGKSSANTLYGNGNQIDFTSKIGIVGVSHFKQLNKNSFLSSTIGVNYSSNYQAGYAYDRITDSTYVKELNKVVKNSLNLSTAYNLKVSPRVFLKAGILDEIMGLDLYYKTKDRLLDSFNQIWDYSSSTHLMQGFAHLKYNLSKKFTMNLGLHSQFFLLNQSKSLEPRLGFVFNITPKSSVNLGYGLHSQMQPINVYFLQTMDASGNALYSNLDLDFTKSHHVVLGYNIQPFKDWRVKTEIYYQSIYQVPVNTFSSSYSMLNTGSTFKADLQSDLVNLGTGENYGAELTIEKFFGQGYYGLLTSSIYRSKYTGSDGIKRNTAFDGKYVFNVLAGKEWKVGDQQRNAFSVDLKYTNAGGRAYTPIDLAASNSLGREQLSTNVYSDYFDLYYRLDLKAGYTFNSAIKRLSHSIFLDLQNLTNHKNIFSQSYDARSQNIRYTYQLGFFPNLVYKFQF